MDQAPDQNTIQNAESKKGPAYGPIIGIVLIVVVLVAGAFYVWGERLKTNYEVPENGVRGEVLPDGSYPTLEGSASVRSGENGPEPI